MIHQDDSMIDLGVGKTVLVRLIKTEELRDVASSYGLYHLAILLPSREALAQIFKHFVDHSVPLIGASDHDYNVLQVQDKFSVRSASWLASGNYHHHLAVNERDEQNLTTRTEGIRGLAYYTVNFKDEQLYRDTIERAKTFAKDVEIGE